MSAQKSHNQSKAHLQWAFDNEHPSASQCSDCKQVFASDVAHLCMTSEPTTTKESVATLKVKLKALNLSVSGKKAVLLARLREATATPTAPVAIASSPKPAPTARVATAPSPKPTRAMKMTSFPESALVSPVQTITYNDTRWTKDQREYDIDSYLSTGRCDRQ